MRFKQWLESLAGPGGGPTAKPIDVLAVNKDIHDKGAGAFPCTGDMPPKPAKTATAGYEDKRFATMKKHMPKN